LGLGSADEAAGVHHRSRRRSSGVAARGTRSFVFSNLRAGHRVEEIVRFIEHKGGLGDSK